MYSKKRVPPWDITVNRPDIVVKWVISWRSQKTVLYLLTCKEEKRLTEQWASPTSEKSWRSRENCRINWPRNYPWLLMAPTDQFINPTSIRPRIDPLASMIMTPRRGSARPLRRLCTPRTIIGMRRFRSRRIRNIWFDLFCTKFISLIEKHDRQEELQEQVHPIRSQIW